MTYCIVISNWHIEMAFQNGVSFWHIVLSYRNGLSNCISDVEWPFTLEIVFSNCMFEYDFIGLDFKMPFNI